MPNSSTSRFRSAKDLDRQGAANDLVGSPRQRNVDHLLVLASNFDTLEFVFLDKKRQAKKGPAGGGHIQVVPKRHSRLDLVKVLVFSHFESFMGWRTIPESFRPKLLDNNH